MSKPNKKRYRLSQVVSEARKVHDPIEVETDDGQVFTIDPPELWPDAAVDPKVGPVDTAIAVMGAAQFEKFCAAGGSASLLNLVVAAYSKDRGVSLGESSAS